MSTFLQVVELLLTNNDAKAQYANDPTTFLDSHGLGSLDSADVSDAMAYAGDALPVDVAMRLDPDAGLESAAALDLEAEGLSLEREPFDLDDTDLDDTDLDEVDLGDSDPYGSDVDFDTPGSPSGEDVEVDAAVEAIELAEDAADSGSTEAVVVEGVTDALDDGPAIDSGDYLTDVPLDDAPLSDSVVDNAQDLAELSLDDLDADLTTDLPDDFDLLD